MTQPMTYEGAGVNYSALDPFKRQAMQCATTTSRLMETLGFTELPWSRGESAYLFQHLESKLILAFVIEGLGTANIVAENAELRAHCHTTFYKSIAISNAAMTFNDMITVGALPVVFGLHPAVESGDHLAGSNGEQLIAGTTEAMEAAVCTYGPGETPALREIIHCGTMCLSGAGVGVVRKQEHLMNSSNMRNGLSIVLLGSSGLHANGYTLARRIASKLPEGYLTDIGDGTPYGQALLAPTTIYVEFTRQCQDQNIGLVYGVNITGHGWRKLMRSPKQLMYVIEQVPDIPPVFRFIMEKGPVTLEEMYKTFNMGAGYAVFVEPRKVDRVLAIAESLSIPAWNVGMTYDGPRKVVIKPLGLTFTELDLR